MFCLPSEASNFSSNKQFSAKFLTRSPSENILLCQQIMQHLLDNILSPAPWSRSTNKTLKKKKKHQFPAYSGKKKILLQSCILWLPDVSVVPPLEYWGALTDGWPERKLFCLEEQKEFKKARTGWPWLLHGAGKPGSEPTPLITGSAKRVPTIPSGCKPTQLHCPSLWPKHACSYNPHGSHHTERRCQKRSCPLECTSSSWISRGIQRFCNSRIFSS